MRVPDHIFPLVACRTWQWDAHGLRSLNGVPWFAGRPQVAECRASHGSRRIHRVKAIHRAHGAPHMDCTCGIYATKNLDKLRQAGYERHGIYGEVYLWGSLVECEFGWRAQFAYPKSFYVLLPALPVALAHIHTRLQALTPYGRDIFIVHNAASIALWRQNSGFEAEGLDLLMRRGQHWYDRRKLERTPRRGDRIAIFGLGMAVAEDVNGDQVNVRVGDHDIFRVGSKTVVWNQQNLRWEVNLPGYSARSDLRREE